MPFPDQAGTIAVCTVDVCECDFAQCHTIASDGFVGIYGAGAVRITACEKSRPGRGADRGSGITVRHGAALADKSVKIGSTGASVTENTEVAVPHIIRQNIDYVGMLILFHH